MSLTRFCLDVVDYYNSGVNFMGTMLNKAITFATKAHKDQMRKGSECPYILHPLEAAAIVATMTFDDEILAAAVLHDVVEDTETTISEIREFFGETVAGYVASESENKREELPADVTWKIRKQETLDHLKNVPIEIKMITLGDKLSNIRSMYRDYNTLGEKLWERFNQKDKSEHYWYYKGIADCLSELKDYNAYKEYCELVEKTFV